MKKIFTKEVRIAIITIIALILLYAGVNHLKGVNVMKPGNYYHVAMQNVSELQTSSPIYIDGFKVGVVREINFDYSGRGRSVVVISLDKNVKVTKGSYVELKSGLTSGAYLNLKLNTYVSEYCAVGDTIGSEMQAGLMDRVAEQMPQIEQILPRLDSILMGIQTLVSHPALTRSLDHIEAATAHLDKSSAQLDALLSKDVPSILSNLDRVSSDFTAVSANLKTIDFQNTMASLDSTVRNLNQISSALNSPDNSLGLLLNDPSLYQQLDSAARNASSLLQDLKQNPKRYVHFSVF